MKPQQIRIEIEKIRAIQSAKIILNGITVITGENGCGKSTISKLTYSLCKASIDYDELVDRQLEFNLSQSYQAIHRIIEDLSYLFPNIINSSDYDTLNKINNRINTKHVFNTISLLIEIFKNNIIDDSGLKRIERIKQILANYFIPTKVDNGLSIIELLELYKNRVQRLLDLARETKDKRPLIITDTIYMNALARMLTSTSLHYDSLNDTYNIYEYDVPLIDRQKNKLLRFHSIQNVAYIDTPMSVGVSDTNQSHWEDLNRLLEKKPVFYDNTIMKNIFQENTLQGEINLKNNEINQKLFVYKRKDGKEFNLLECATGLRSFAILQILYKNGFLNNKTLLIIDEPEAHLHPQWVVEYARLIVLLHKYIGVRFLIASHHPDMISAIKYISEKESVDSDLNFYLAKKRSNGYRYSYKNLGTDIEEVFASFNIAFERIDQYGVTE